MLLLIDNYDSFSYNLYQLAGTIEPDIRVVRNDKISVNEIRSLSPEHIIISPGPGRPKNAGMCEKIIGEMKDSTPILGICLGHQCICETFGAEIVHAPVLMHGKADIIRIDNSCKLFTNLPEEISAARYHSLVADRSSVPDCLEVTAADHTGEVMAVKHKDCEIYGLQFHPESILTPLGRNILVNFLRRSA